MVHSVIVWPHPRPIPRFSMLQAGDEAIVAIVMVQR